GLGGMETPHGPVPTPAFMPVGTLATVKAMTPEEVAATGAAMILANTYHLHLRPGEDVVAAAGGIHRFTHWPGPILTDSGGFQVFSLARLRRIDDDGVDFRSHVDGSLHRLTPEGVVHIQEALGADIIMPLDECVAFPCDWDAAAAAVRRTSLWARRSVLAKRRPDQALFGIVQGAVDPDLRRRSAAELVELALPGYAVGGLSVGEPKDVMYAVLDLVLPLLPQDRPRYVMGLGAPDDILEAVWRGADLFDSVLPTRLGRNGLALTAGGRVALRNAAWKRDFRPIQEGCDCYACRHFTRAYVRHLLKAGEILGARLVTWHNLHFLQRWMEEIRRAIAEGTLAEHRRRVRESGVRLF
ncbi:MAG: tRNA guanosine(34) transglycosylase Tgt, partial [Clostridia bacterium]|nr:tRNA guanosine(34) transglycosylase Tgt [Clostridia bacterium]